MRGNFTHGLASQEQVAEARAGVCGAEYNALAALVAYLNAAAQYESTMGADPFAHPSAIP